MGVLQQACINTNLEWIASLPENPPQPEYSEKYLKNINKLLDKMRDDRYHRFTSKTARVILVAAIVMAISTVTVFATTDIGSYILNELQDHAIFQSLFESDEKVDGKIECGYIPEGFEKTSELCGELKCILIYENDEGNHLSITKIINGEEIVFDNEESKTTIIQTDTKEFIIYEKSNSDIRVVWCNSKYSYIISGNLSIEDTLKIAENVK